MIERVTRPFRLPSHSQHAMLLALAFLVTACNPQVTGSCDTASPSSDLRRSARSFCQRAGTTVVSPATGGLRIGGQAAPYAGEDAANPGTTRTSGEGEVWVSPLNGLVGTLPGATVFSQVNCVKVG